MAGTPSYSSLMTHLLPRMHAIPGRKEGEARKYAGVVTCSTEVRGHREVTSNHITFELVDRFTYCKGSQFAHNEWMRDLFGPREATTHACYKTPEGVRASLIGYHRLKAVMTCGWEFFNMDGVVYVLGAMLATMTQDPTLGTKDFMGNLKHEVKGVNQNSDLAVCNSAGHVFIDRTFAPCSKTNALWALVTAVNLAGGSVVLPFADCDGNGAALCGEVRGRLLLNGITTALNILASLYSMAGAGDSFALALARGVHTVLSVVAHSDEGGIMRDVLRINDYNAPYGGVPCGIPICSGVPILDGGSHAELCSWVDGFALMSAALVAHCDPMIMAEGNIFPTIVTAEAVVGPGTALSAGTIRRSEMATLVANAAATGFVSTYVRALARLFSLQCDVGSSVAGDSLLSAFQVFAQAGSRHTDYDVLAPFFWIEPSCIIPKGYLGTTAELGGAGSFGIMGEESTIPMFEEADEMGEPSDISTDWAFNFRSPRTCGYVLMYARHYRDGLAMLQLKSFDSHRISLSRREASELYNLKAQQGFVTIDQLMWVRGQSQLPHPAEACCIDGRVGATLWHGSCTDMYRRKAYPWLPEYREVAHAQVNICPGRLYFAGVGAACEDSCQAKRVRNRATQALEMAREWVTRTSAVMRPGVLVAESAPPRRRPAERVPLPAAEHRDNEDSGGMFMGTNITKAAPPVLGEGAVTTARPVPIARVHGSVIAPAPRPVGAPAAPGLGETGVGAGIAAQPSDYQSPPSAVSQQGSVAPSSGAAAAP